MSKIVFFGIPAHGHTNPTLNVVRELVSRGHEVWYYSYNFLREKIESAGANFVSCDKYDTQFNITSKDSARIGKDLVFSIKLLVDITLALDEKVCEEIYALDPDCIVADSMALWGKMVATKLDIPFVSSTTTFAFNKYSAKIMKQSVLDIFKMILSTIKANKEINRLKERGYLVSNIVDIIGNDDKTNTIVYTSSEFQPCSDTFSDNYTFVGPCIRPSYEIVQKTKNKLVYISMGTVNNYMIPIYQTSISAFSDTDYQVILSVGDKVNLDDFSNLPENISIVPFVDQIAVLKEADVFITHAGMNSVSESLYFEVPLIMLPQTSEQKGVAERVSQLGAGIVLNKLDNNSLLETVEEIFSQPSYKVKCKEISKGFKSSSGEKGAADKILEISKTKRND